jgi:hypothetical protein
MKVECKLRDYDYQIGWDKGEDRLIVSRPKLEPSGFVIVRIEDKECMACAAELIDAVRACAK